MNNKADGYVDGPTDGTADMYVYTQPNGHADREQAYTFRKKDMWMHKWTVWQTDRAGHKMKLQ